MSILAAGVAYSGVLPPPTEYQMFFLKLTHLLSMAWTIGVGNYTSFIAGIVMYKTLPRHTFGNLQSKLFPTYFQVQLTP